MQHTIASAGQRRTLWPRAALVGLLAGGVAVAFRWALEASEGLRHHLLAWVSHGALWTMSIPILAGAAGAGVAVLLVYRVAPEASGSGIPHVKAVLYRLRSMSWPSLLSVKFVGGALAIGSGLALGREGPTIQMGSAVGAAVARWLGVAPRERQTLIAAGAGAGLAAAFNAPLSGVTFVLEELQQHFAPTIFGATLIAALLADVVARSLTSQLPVFHVETTPTPPLLALPAFLVLGMLAGALGVAFNRVLLATMERMSRIRRWPIGLTAALVGASIGAIGLLVPEALGGGQRLVEAALEGHMALLGIPLWFLLRFALTMLSYGCGAPGGIFAPLLVLGALLGLAVGQVAQLCLPETVTHAEAFAVVGMAAYFTAIVRAPLTGVVLVVEMTNSYTQMLPLLVACFSAYAVADLWSEPPIYESMLDRDLHRGGPVPTAAEPLVLEFIVHDGSPFDGKKVQDLGLPHGCLLVTIHRGRYDTVPMADTRLEAGDRLTLVVAPAVAEAIMLLREGCAPPHPPGAAWGHGTQHGGAP